MAAERCRNKCYPWPLISKTTKRITGKKLIAQSLCFVISVIRAPVVLSGKAVANNGNTPQSFATVDRNYWITKAMIPLNKNAAQWQVASCDQFYFEKQNRVIEGQHGPAAMVLAGRAQLQARHSKVCVPHQ